jgi:hypothetical protein
MRKRHTHGMYGRRVRRGIGQLLERRGARKIPGGKDKRKGGRKTN